MDDDTRAQLAQQWCRFCDHCPSQVLIVFASTNVRQLPGDLARLLSEGTCIELTAPGP
jgi:hypothetical protein